MGGVALWLSVVCAFVKPWRLEEDIRSAGAGVRGWLWALGMGAVPQAQVLRKSSPWTVPPPHTLSPYTVSVAMYTLVFEVSALCRADLWRIITETLIRSCFSFMWIRLHWFSSLILIMCTDLYSIKSESSLYFCMSRQSRLKEGRTISVSGNFSLIHTIILWGWDVSSFWKWQLPTILLWLSYCHLWRTHLGCFPHSYVQSGRKIIL